MRNVRVRSTFWKTKERKYDEKNDEEKWRVSFEELEEWGDKYRDAVAWDNIPVDEVESNLRSFKKL